ncbi:MAG: hypothetical protein JRG81_02730 [Deltaproteobacteria bacterium]|nr:hypothetical protein [Deltaproteobacteria bacterium]
MPNKHQFNYFLYSPENLVRENSTAWKAPLPLGRNMLGGTFIEVPGNSFEVGDYFESVRVFLTHQGIDPILKYASEALDQDISKDEINVFNVTLKKHGEFYHPARIDTEICGEKLSFVLNVAISNPGKSLVKKEFYLLQKLNTKFHPSYLPEVFCVGESQTKQHQKAIMFLGQWLEDFNEFHMSYDPKTRRNRVKVWAPDERYFLSDKKAAKLYRQAAKILTLYYAIDSFEQILSWHHAAGDFVVQIANNDVSLKLITVRNYASMFKGDATSGKDDDTGTILEALLLFLLNMSIRIRVDRLDGVEDFIWSENIAVENCLLGFYQALKEHDGLQTGFADAFFDNYLSSFSHSILYELSVSMVEKYYQNISEIDVIQRNLKEHIEVLHTAIHSLTKSPQQLS